MWSAQRLLMERQQRHRASNDRIPTGEYEYIPDNAGGEKKSNKEGARA